MENKIMYLIVDYDNKGCVIRGLYDCSPSYLSSFTKNNSNKVTQVIKIPLNKKVDQFLTV